MTSLRRWVSHILTIALMPPMAGLCGCNDRADGLPPPERAVSDSVQPELGDRCLRFIAQFDVAVACERANGTLLSFTDNRTKWRVRYFVRYLHMPCGEFPTVREAYVFHTVMNDLYLDADLTLGDRLEIRAAMFNGQIKCK